MKSAIISLVVLILIFVLLKYGALEVIGSKAFHYTAFILFIIAMGAAMYFVGIREGSDNNREDMPTTQEDKTHEE